MKVTKRQLKRIIREEYKRIIKESGPYMPPEGVTSWGPTKQPGDDFSDLAGGQYTRRGHFASRDSDLPPVAIESLVDYIEDYGAPNVSPSFWEDFKLKEYSNSEVEQLRSWLQSITGEPWESVSGDDFLENLDDEIAFRKENNYEPMS